MARFEHEILDVNRADIEQATGEKIQDVITDVVIATRQECAEGVRCGMFAGVQSYTRTEHPNPTDWVGGLMSEDYQRRYPDSVEVSGLKFVTGCTKSSCTEGQCALESLRRKLSELSPRCKDAIEKAKGAVRATGESFESRRAELDLARAELDAEAERARTAARQAVLAAFRSELGTSIRSTQTV